MTLTYGEKIAKLEKDFGVTDYTEPEHSSWNDPAFLDAMIKLEIFNGTNFSKFSADVRSDPTCIAKAVGFKSTHLQKPPLQFATEKARDEEDVIFHAFSVNPTNLQFASSRLKASPCFIDRLVSSRKNVGHIAPFLPKEVLSDQHLARLLISSNNLNYLDLDERLLRDEDITFCAMNTQREKSYEQIFSEAPFELTANVKFFDRCFNGAKPGPYKTKTQVKSEIKKLHRRAKEGLKGKRPLEIFDNKAKLNDIAEKLKKRTYIDTDEIRKSLTEIAQKIFPDASKDKATLKRFAELSWAVGSLNETTLSHFDQKVLSDESFVKSLSLATDGNFEKLLRGK